MVVVHEPFSQELQAIFKEVTRIRSCLDHIDSYLEQIADESLINEEVNTHGSTVDKV